MEGGTLLQSPTSALRRPDRVPSLAHPLAAVLTLLSLLLGTLGRAHSSCGAGSASAPAWVASTSVASPVDPRRAEGGHDEHCAGGPVDGSSRTPSPERDGMPAADGCASVAHCVTWTVATRELAVAPSPSLPAAPRAPHDAPIPLGPDAEPDCPPPRA